MLRRYLLNKPIRMLSSIYDKNYYKKYYNNSKKIDFDLVFWNYCIGGGIGGGAYSSYLTYKSIRDTTSYTVCVVETSIMSLYGFVLGFSFSLISPILIPFAGVISIFRYLDPPK